MSLATKQVRTQTKFKGKEFNKSEIFLQICFDCKEKQTLPS